MSHRRDVASETVNVTLDFVPNLKRANLEPIVAAARQTRGLDRNPAMRASAGCRMPAGKPAAAVRN